MHGSSAAQQGGCVRAYSTSPPSPRRGEIQRFDRCMLHTNTHTTNLSPPFGIGASEPLMPYTKYIIRSIPCKLVVVYTHMLYGISLSLSSSRPPPVSSNLHGYDDTTAAVDLTTAAATSEPLLSSEDSAHTTRRTREHAPAPPPA